MTRSAAPPRALYRRARQQLRRWYHNAPYWLRGAPDGLPIPPLKLRELIWEESADLRIFFQHAGRMRYLFDVLRQLGAAVDDFDAVLDFGCGAGRDIRQFRRSGSRAKVYGTDINADQIAWCRAHLTFAEFDTNHAYPPLRYDDAHFDFIYTFSVFTHLSEPQQFVWLGELARVLRPGGHLLITTCGDPDVLTPEEQEQFRAGQLVVRNAAAAGVPSIYGACIVYHPFQYVTDTLAKNWELVRFVPRDPHGPVGDMDQYFLRKA